MKKKFIGIMLSMLICIMAVPIHLITFAENEYCPFAGGTGTEDDPYQIASAYHLRLMSELINDDITSLEYFDKHYIQTADIDLKKQDFTPIGTYTEGNTSSHGFWGTYNGNYKNIYGLRIERTTGYDGVFGWLYQGIIENLTVYGEVNCSEVVNCGGILGELGSGSIVRNCAFIGNVNGRSLSGGVIGHCWVGGAVESCYFNGDVTAYASDGSAGGVIGAVNVGDGEKIGIFNIKNCYAVGNIHGTYTGGVIGTIFKRNADSTISIQNNYYLTGMADSGINGDVLTGCTGFNGKSLKADMVGSPFVDNYEKNDFNGGYPIFEWQITPYEFKGSGTEQDPYQISSKEELESMRDLVNNRFFNDKYGDKYYIQMKDIDLQNELWKPIGTLCINGIGYAYATFCGKYDGNHHSINNLNVNENDNYAGLFGRLGEGKEGIICNLAVTGTVNSSGKYVGGICGEIAFNSLIKNCSFNGDVAGNAYVGGIVGKVYKQGTISSCYHNGKVHADSIAGGIMGWIYIDSLDTSIDSCYHTGKITADDGNAGALVGKSEISIENPSNIKITNCYTLNGDCNNNIAVNGITTECYVLVQTASQLKSIADDLGDEYVNNTRSMFNNGYPIFYWQASFMGDVNHDDSFTVVDIVILQKWLHGSGHLQKWENADFNGDKIINVYDLCLMKKALLNKR